MHTELGVRPRRFERMQHPHVLVFVILSIIDKLGLRQQRPQHQGMIRCLGGCNIDCQSSADLCSLWALPASPAGGLLSLDAHPFVTGTHSLRPYLTASLASREFTWATSRLSSIVLISWYGWGMSSIDKCYMGHLMLRIMRWWKN